MKFIHLVWANLKRKKLRTSLTLLSIVVAFVLFGILSAVKQALTGGVEMAGADRLIVPNRVSLILPLPAGYRQRIEKIPGVAGVTEDTWFGGVYKDQSTSFFAKFPVVPEEYLKMYPEIALPADQAKAWEATRTGAIIGTNLAKRFGWKIGDKIPIIGNIYTKSGGGNWEFDIVGIYTAAKKGFDTTQMFFRYDYFDEARQYDKGAVGWYIVRVANPQNAADVAKRVDEEFANSSAETQTAPEAAFYQAFVKQLGNIALIVALILSAVFITILMVAGNTMAQAVRERTGELGVLKAIGFTNGQVLGLVMAESCLICIAGGVIGLGLAWVVALQGDPTGGSLPTYYLPTRDLLYGLGLSVALGIVTGLAPAVQAMRLQVATALRRM
jgi:putative ABC transport system permease protein